MDNHGTIQPPSEGMALPKTFHELTQTTDLPGCTVVLTWGRYATKQMCNVVDDILLSKNGPTKILYGTVVKNLDFIIFCNFTHVHVLVRVKKIR